MRQLCEARRRKFCLPCSQTSPAQDFARRLCDPTACSRFDYTAQRWSSACPVDDETWWTNLLLSLWRLSPSVLVAESDAR